jgi:hypothetical protein
VGEKIPVAGAQSIDKTSTAVNEPRWAWGLYAFRKSVGKTLLSAQLESCRDHRLKNLPLKSAAVTLTEFKDLTRGDIELAMPLTPQPADVKKSARDILG